METIGEPLFEVNWHVFKFPWLSLFLILDVIVVVASKTWIVFNI